MDRCVVLSCVVSALTSVPVIAGVVSAWRVEDDRLSPAVRAGDVVCCGAPLGQDDAPPKLAVAHAPSLGNRLVPFPSAMEFAAVLPVCFIIKR